jgi:hypothetical protein
MDNSISSGEWKVGINWYSAMWDVFLVHLTERHAIFYILIFSSEFTSELI